MTQVTDLHIDEEILPLFDFTHNEGARQALLKLFHTIPSSVSEIRKRQDILKGFQKNNKVLATYSYSKIDFSEVYRFIEYQASTHSTSGESSMRRRIQFIFSGEKRQKAASQLTQFISFFHRLSLRYLDSMDRKAFPDEFRSKLEQMSIFISHFHLAFFEPLSRNGEDLQPRHLVDLTLRIEAKISSKETSLFWENFFLFEAYLSLSTGIAQQNFVLPEFIEGTFSITDFYHPLVKSPVKNSLTLTTNVILLSGPNMSGKSTLLKAAGLCVYLGHLGFGVPATTCVIPFFESITTAINLNDDLKNGYSHFMTEIRTLKEVVTGASQSKRCFAVFDEIFRGTNEDDAYEISRTTLSGLRKFTNSIFFISTHLHRLKGLAEEKENKISTYHMQCSLHSGRPVFTYTLENGWSDLKIGKILFEQEGLNTLLS